MKGSRDTLRSSLDAVRRRWRAVALLRSGGRAALAAAAPIAAAATVASVLDLADGVLVLLMVSAGLVALGAACLVAWQIPRRPSDRQVARFVEERIATQTEVPPLDDVLVSALDANDHQHQTDGFHAFVAETARRRLDQIPLTTIVPSDAVRRARIEACFGAAALGVAVFAAWPSIAHTAEAAWIAMFPASIHVEVLPGNVRVPAGKPVTIRASVRTGKSALTRFTPKVTVAAGGEQRGVTMTPAGDGFELSIESVDRTFTYRVTAGSARSDEYTVTALFAPRVERIDLHYEYPQFSKLPARDERDGGDIYAPAGTKVRVKVHTDKPIANGEMVFRREAGPRVAEPATKAATENSGLQATSERTLEGELTLAKDDSYRITLQDRDGLRSAGDTEYFIRVMADRPPDVRILRPEGDQQVTPLEEVAIEARAEDDYGIDRFELVYAVAGREPKVVPLTNAKGTDLAKVGAHVLAIEDLRVQPGDVISYYARARDIGRGKRSTQTSSDMYFLEVRPFSEEFVAAQSQGMPGVTGDQIEGLIAAQKEIINATWNIERRASSGAGRSATDITAIADAQAELKARAEQMMSMGPRGRPMRAPQQIGLTRQPRGSRSGSDPVGTAISAMGKAVDQLQGQRTSDALPHEMAALQGLIQAQAEVRRREVAQQSGASFGGMGRQGQDLSALFDKELQRQQRTNYETRSQAETRPDRDENTSALDRIRDLARRQEELGRQQRELAGQSLTPEEAKRRLEKLTREQEELQQQAEQLSRQMGQSSGQPQRGETPQQARGNGGGMRDAAEEMRGAASELQRQAPGNAADRADRAAARLRQLEQQMRGDSPEARQRAAGELRLEAQQIADEQRRIAGEAERLEKNAKNAKNARNGNNAGNANNADTDAWRRLAGEKDKLADRVDELRRGTEQLAGAERKDGRGAQAGQPDGSKETVAAAQELGRQKLAERMRETARQIRESAGQEPTAGGRSGKPAPAPRAGAEQELARAMDQVVDRLAGGVGADAQRLSAQLDEAKGIRDRLDQLERRLREAEAAAGKNGAGRPGREGRAGSGANGDQALQQLREEYGKEVQRARQSLARLERGSPGGALGGATPEEHEWSVTDQGTEAFKQDFSKWESLRKDVDSALERYEASVVSAAARKSLQDRLSAGGSDRVPDAYRRLIARYYESLARKK